MFFISLLPYNAFHHHQDELHKIAVVGNDESHHCKLDEYACQADLLQNHDCQHQNHLIESTPDCFFCQFHFNQLFEITVPISKFSLTSGTSICTKINLQFLESLIIVLFNKGPPFVNESSNSL